MKTMITILIGCIISMTVMGHGVMDAGNDDKAGICVSMFDGDLAIIISGGKKSKIKPKVTAFIKVFDEDKSAVWKNKATLKNFSSLRTIESTRGAVTKT